MSLPVIKPQSESASRPGRLGFVYSTLVVRCAARLGTSQQQLLLLERCQGNSLHKNRLRVILFFPPRRVANERNVKGQWITRQIVSFTSFTPPPPPISISDTLFSTSCLFLFSFRPVSSKPAVFLSTRQFLFFFLYFGLRIMYTERGKE